MPSQAHTRAAGGGTDHLKLMELLELRDRQQIADLYVLLVTILDANDYDALVTI